MDSFALYCLATEIRPTEILRVLGLIDKGLARNPQDLEARLYKGALLARMGLGLDDSDQAQRFLYTGAEIMRAMRIAIPVRPLVQLRMLYACGTTQVVLPVPPMTAAEMHKGIADILDHPGFNQLHRTRRAVVLGMQAHLLHRQGRDRIAEQVWRTATRIDSRLSGFPDRSPQIIL